MSLGLGYFRGHPILSFSKFDDRVGLLTTPLLDPRHVADPESFELPDELNARVPAARHLVEAAVGADAEESRLNQHSGALEAVQHDDREERPHLLGANPHLRRLDERFVRGEFGAVVQSDPHQVVELEGGIDQGDLEVIVLLRLDHREGPDEELASGRPVHTPLFPRRRGLLLKVGQKVLAR